VNKNKPELVEILNWGIDQLDDNFILAMQSTWADYSLDDHNVITQINKDISLISVSLYALFCVTGVVFLRLSLPVLSR
jgi:hypothetical protein